MDHIDSGQRQFERIFRANHVAVHAYIRRRATADAVDDIVSETFLVAWRRLDSVPAEPLPWLLGVARNTIATRNRGDARRLRLQARAEAEYQYINQELESQRFESGPVVAGLARLNAGDREALTLVAWDGLTPAQAAEALGIPANRFRVRLHRAARRLRWALDAGSEESDPERQEGRNPNTTSEGAIA
jgi:RNA polymerase sigma-70 factor (ECF subfamily)